MATGLWEARWLSKPTFEARATRNQPEHTQISQQTLFPQFFRIEPALASALLAQSARGGSGAKFSLLAPHPFLADRPKWLSKRTFEAPDFSQPCGQISSRSRVDLCPSLQGSLQGSLRFYFAKSILARFDTAKYSAK